MQFKDGKSVKLVSTTTLCSVNALITSNGAISQESNKCYSTTKGIVIIPNGTFCNHFDIFPRWEKVFLENAAML